MLPVKIYGSWQQETFDLAPTRQREAQAMQKAKDNRVQSDASGDGLAVAPPASSDASDGHAPSDGHATSDGHFALSFDQKLRLLRLREISLPAWSEYASTQQKLNAVARLVGDTAPNLLHYFYIAHAQLKAGITVSYADLRLLMLLLELEQIGLVVTTADEASIEGKLSSEGHEFLQQLQLMMGDAFVEMNHHVEAVQTDAEGAGPYGEL